MATLLEDIGKSSDWIVKAFAADKLKLDYSPESLKVVDSFFDLHSKEGKATPGGRLVQNLGQILFSIGSYVGETIIRNVPGAEWITDDADPEGEVNVKIALPGQVHIMPVQRVLKRFRNGPEDSIYAYGVVAIRDMADGNYWEKTKQLAARQQAESATSPHQASSATPVKKPWWKFW